MWFFALGYGARLLAPPGVVLRGWQMSQPSIRCDRASVSPEVWRGMARVWERQRREAQSPPPGPSTPEEPTEPPAPFLPLATSRDLPRKPTDPWLEDARLAASLERECGCDRCAYCLVFPLMQRLAQGILSTS